MVASMVLARISTTWNRPKQMIIGNFVMVLAFLMLGPCPLFFHKSLSWNLSGLLMIGLGCALIYIPSMPHMIQVAQEDYGFGSDDRLNDAIAGITNISLCLGEFFGPLAASALYEPVGFRYGTSVISILILLFGLFYLKNCEFSRSLLKVNPVDSELVLM
jgi:MFS family permease